jgi:hypothetical protein
VRPRCVPERPDAQRAGHRARERAPTARRPAPALPDGYASTSPNLG